MTSIGPYNMGVEEFRPRRGQYGEERKSVKKNAALLRFLAFLLLDHTFGVLRGEQPLRRGPLPRNSGTFFATFFGHKKGSLAGGCRYKEVPPQGGGTERHQPTKRTCKLAEPWVTLYRSTMVKFDSNQE